MNNGLIENHHPNLQVAGVSLDGNSLCVRLLPILAWRLAGDEWMALTVASTRPVPINRSAQTLTKDDELLLLNRDDLYLVDNEWIDEAELAVELLPPIRTA